MKYHFNGSFGYKAFHFNRFKYVVELKKHLKDQFCIFQKIYLIQVKKKMPPKSKKNGRVGSRTQDLSHAKGARYQLRHTPVVIIILNLSNH